MERLTEKYAEPFMGTTVEGYVKNKDCEDIEKWLRKVLGDETN